jgi:hypothetical protein
LTVSAAIAADGVNKMYGEWADTNRDTDATAAAPCQANATAR